MLERFVPSDLFCITYLFSPSVESWSDVFFFLQQCKISPTKRSMVWMNYSGNNIDSSWILDLFLCLQYLCLKLMIGTFCLTSLISCSLFYVWLQCNVLGSLIFTLLVEQWAHSSCKCAFIVSTLFNKQPRVQSTLLYLSRKGRAR
jgi:hypothetical protein